MCALESIVVPTAPTTPVPKAPISHKPFSFLTPPIPALKRPSAVR